MTRELTSLLRSHFDAPFPTSVIKGEEYGRVDPVMIDADVYGWATRASGHSIDAQESERFRRAADDLAMSLCSFPKDARLYFTRLLLLAEVALATLDAKIQP